MEKIKYEKPITLDAGKIASVLGANCSNGDTPEDGACNNGINPQLVYKCAGTGLTADTNCDKNGGTAGEVCVATGSIPGYGCISPS